jgi:hypothetical protein
MSVLMGVRSAHTFFFLFSLSQCLMMSLFGLGRYISYGHGGMRNEGEPIEVVVIDYTGCRQGKKDFEEIAVVQP